MKKTIIKFFDKLLVLLLGIFGIFNSCQPVEYGTPHGDYELKGMVIDKETSNPIPNIQIVGEYLGIIYSDTDGKYVLYNDMFRNFLLTVKDIDGEDNGGYFKPTEIDVKFTKSDQVEKGDGHWYDGKFVKTQNIELEKEK
jgi:putative lipoprotein (rSAM/lipoprotein system)